MLKAPAFWADGRGTILGKLMSPIAALTAAVTARRAARPGWRAPVPVICCGNVTVGGAGKTTLALDLGQRLLARGHTVHFLLRGYGGLGPSHPSGRARRYRGTGRRRGAAAGRGRADLGGRQPRRQRPCRGCCRRT